MRPGVASHGYATVSLGRDNSKTLHSLVAEAFLGPCPKGQEVRHKDGLRTNHEASNLEYGTRSQNNIDASIFGRRKLKVEDVSKIKKIKNLKRGVAPKLAIKFGVSNHCIYGVLKEKSWKYVPWN